MFGSIAEPAPEIKTSRSFDGADAASTPQKFSLFSSALNLSQEFARIRGYIVAAARVEPLGSGRGA
jgi:hypothetical protein